MMQWIKAYMMIVSLFCMVLIDGDAFVHIPSRPTILILSIQRRILIGSSLQLEVPFEVKPSIRHVINLEVKTITKP